MIWKKFTLWDKCHEIKTGIFLEESDTEHDERRLGLPYYDAVQDSADLRQVMDPFHLETGTTPHADSTITLHREMFKSDREI